METNYITPKFNRKEKIAGVYKITFDNNKFYIGGSVNLRARLSQWKTNLRLRINKNREMRELVKTTKEVLFEVLEKTIPTEFTRSREDHYIKKYWDDPLLLNKCPNAHNNIGLRFKQEDLINRKRSTVFAKPVAVFDLDWNFIKNFDFIADAQKELKLGKRGSVSDFMNGRCQYVKGYKFKLIDKDGNYIEPNPFFSKKPPLKPKKIPQPNTPSKEIIQYNLLGNEVRRFDSIHKAVYYLKTERKNFSKIVSGKRSKTGYFKGFIYKYA